MVKPAINPAIRSHSQQRSKERIGGILKAAEQILIEHGYGELTMRRVADRVGMALGNLQYYFPTRQDLVRGLTADMCGRYQQAVQEQAERYATAEQRLEGVINYILDDIRKPEGSILFWDLWALSGHDPAAAEAVADLLAFEHDLIAALIREINPAVTSKQAKLRSATICSLMEGSTLFLGTGRSHAATPLPLRRELMTTAFDIAHRPTME